MGNKGKFAYEVPRKESQIRFDSMTDQCGDGRGGFEGGKGGFLGRGNFFEENEYRCEKNGGVGVRVEAIDRLKGFIVSLGRKLEMPPDFVEFSSKIGQLSNMDLL